MAKATPRRLAASSAGLDVAQLSQPPGMDVWSVLTIVNHLRACDEVWMHSVYTMTQSFSAGLRIFTLRRDALIVTLEALTLADWAREGRIDRKTHTVYSLVKRLAFHEDVHCTQIDNLLNGNG